MREQALHQMLTDLLSSGDPNAIIAVEESIMALHERFCQDVSHSGVQVTPSTLAT